MRYRRLGSSGLQLSELSFGAWVTFGNQIGRSQARELIATAWDHGINFFDNAEVYAKGEAERIMGDVIADLRLPRDGYCVSSKAFFGSAREPRPNQTGLSRKHLHDACHAALKRLRVDYLDLFLCHRPDPDVPIIETVSAMDHLIRQGKVMYWGTSEWPAAGIREAVRLARAHHLHAPTLEQPQYNLLHRQRVEQEYLPLYGDCGLGLTTWSPLASGWLSGKYRQGTPADSRFAVAAYDGLRERTLGAPELQRERRIDAFVGFARTIGVAPAPLAIAWCLRNPHVSTVLLGASKPAQLVENLQALTLRDGLDEGTWQALMDTVD